MSLFGDEPEEDEEGKEYKLALEEFRRKLRTDPTTLQIVQENRALGFERGQCIGEAVGLMKGMTTRLLEEARWTSKQQMALQSLLEDIQKCELLFLGIGTRSSSQEEQEEVDEKELSKTCQKFLRCVRVSLRIQNTVDFGPIELLAQEDATW